jgi:hypothetical protein
MLLMRLHDFISYEALDFSFSDEGKVLERDITAVLVLSILYCKDRLLDFSVDVFGDGYIDVLPLYSEVMPVDSGEVLSAPIISPLFVLKMFDKRILQLLSNKGLCIYWNPEWSTSAKIDPLFPDISITR